MNNILNEDSDEYKKFVALIEHIVNEFNYGSKYKVEKYLQHVNLLYEIDRGPYHLYTSIVFEDICEEDINLFSDIILNLENNGLKMFHYIRDYEGAKEIEFRTMSVGVDVGSLMAN